MAGALVLALIAGVSIARAVGDRNEDPKPECKGAGADEVNANDGDTIDGGGDRIFGGGDIHN